MSLCRLIRPWLLALTFGFLSTGCGGSTAKAPKFVVPSTKPVPLKVTAVELVSQTNQNGTAAQAKYRNKLLDVTGVVSKTLTEDNLSVPNVHLIGIELPKTQPKGKRKRVELGADGLKASYEPEERVDCRFPKEQALRVAALVPGQQVTIRGKCRGGIYLAELIDAEIISTGEIPLKSYTLPELRKALGKDRAGIPESLEAPIILQGTVKSIEAGKAPYSTYILLAEDASGSALPPLTVRLRIGTHGISPLLAVYFKGLKAGDAFRAYGRLTGSGNMFELHSYRGTLLLPR